MQRGERSQQVLRSGRLLLGRWCAGILLVLLAGLFAPYAFRHVQAWGTSAGSSRLELSATEIDLGEGAPNEIVRGVLQLRNSGSAPLTFSIERSCGCTELQPNKGTIPAGKQLEIAVGVRLPGHTGSEQNVSLTVNSNDPERPVVHCAILALCPAPFDVSPAFVNFGELLQDDIASAVQVLEVRGNDGNPPPDFDRLQVRHKSPLMRVAKRRMAGRPHQIRVSLSPDLSRGDLYDTIELTGAGSERVVRVPVSARIVDPVSIVPSTVFLRVDPETGTYSPVELLIVSRRGALPSDGLKILGGPAGVRVEELKEDPASSTRRRVRLIVAGGAALEAETELRLSFKEENVPLTLTLMKPPPR